MKTNNTIIAYYTSLAALISDEAFVESSAEAVVTLAEEIKPIESRKDVLDFLRQAHEEYHDNNRDLDIMTSLAEKAFEDLAPHMHDVNARKAFRRLTEMSGTGEVQDLYSHVSNVRYLGKDKNGMAVVTLVVSSYRELKDLLENPGGATVEEGHLSTLV